MDDKVKAWEPYFDKPCAVQLREPLAVTDVDKDPTSLEPIMLRGGDGNTYGQPGGELRLQQVMFGAIRASENGCFVEVRFKLQTGSEAVVAVRPDQIGYVTLITNVPVRSRLVM